MTDKERSNLEKKVLLWLRKEGPIRSSELLLKHQVPAQVLRRTIWSLVDDGRAQYTADRRIEAVGE